MAAMNHARINAAYPSTYSHQPEEQRHPQSAAAASSGLVSNAVVAGPSTNRQSLFVEPKYKTIFDAEQTVDKQQAESLRRLRMGYRLPHPFISNQQDYFYRRFLLPAAIKIFCKQVAGTLFLLAFWSFISDFVFVGFEHLYLEPKESLIVDVFRLDLFRNLKDSGNIYCAVALAVSASWYFVQNIWIPPPLFRTRHQKTSAFFRTLSLSGPWLVVCVGLLFMKQDFRPRGSTSAVAAHESGLHSPEVGYWQYSRQAVFGEIIPKVLLPFLYSLFAVIATTAVLFWKGEFYIGSLSAHRRILDVFSAPNITGILRKFKILTWEIIHWACEHFLSFPGIVFLAILLVLFILPVFFPIADVVAVWIRCHFMTFALIQSWKLDLTIVKRSVTSLTNVADLPFLDVLDLPPVLTELRKTGWRWSAYLELQLLAGVQEKLRKDPNYLREFFGMRHQSRDLMKLDNLIQFWLVPVRNYVKSMEKTNLELSLNAEQSRKSDGFSSWMLDRLFAFYQIYDESFVVWEQDFLGSENARTVGSSFQIVAHLKLLIQFVIVSKTFDNQQIMANRYDMILEQVGALVCILRNSEKSTTAQFGDATLLRASSNLESGIRFHLKWYRQLVHIAEIYLDDMLRVINKDVGEMHFKEYPAVMSFLENFKLTEKDTENAGEEL